jgi:hypothetical protein
MLVLDAGEIASTRRALSTDLRRIRLRNGWPPHFDHEKLDRMRNLPDASENARRKKRGFWGESRLAFESIVEEVRRFVARMPPADYSAGSACYLRNFSALGDQRAEIFPVQRPRTLSLSARRMMRLTRILIFPYFSLSITDQLPPTSRGFPQCPEKLSLETRKGYTPLTGQST